MTDHPTLGVVDVYAATLPTVAFEPGLHINRDETALPMRDGLPTFPNYPTVFRGSGETMAE